MQLEQKKIIQYALQFDINNIHTYSGYKGGLVLKITTSKADVVNTIESYALTLPVLEVVVKHNQLMEFEIYCITEDENIYGLKFR